MLLTSPGDPNATWSSFAFQSALAPETAIGLAFEAFSFNNWHTPLLIMGSTRDSLTPYGWAADMARTFRNSRVITYVGSTHTPFLAGSTCIDRYGIDYLIGLRRPRVDAACPNTLMDPGRPPHRRVAATCGIL
jgi:pimeloyl-ACP methyl ester carboxylesterase